MASTESLRNPIDEVIATLGFLPNRAPTTSAEELTDAFARLSNHRDSGVLVGHWAGTSEWERHSVGDEIVMVLRGRPTIFFLDGEVDRAAALSASEMVIVPQGHGIGSRPPDEATILSVRPLPTDHSADRIS
jgi:hypothetical protein